MSEVKRTYLISFSHTRGFGSFDHWRTTDDAPTMREIQAMVINAATEHGLDGPSPIAISLIGNDPAGEVTP